MYPYVLLKHKVYQKKIYTTSFLSIIKLNHHTSSYVHPISFSQRFILFGLLFIQISCARNPGNGVKSNWLYSCREKQGSGRWEKSWSDPENHAFFFGRYDDPDLQAFIYRKKGE